MDLERFFVGKRRDSNPQGCKAEETRKRFPAQHARSEATQQGAAAEQADAESLRPSQKDIVALLYYAILVSTRPTATVRA